MPIPTTYHFIRYLAAKKTVDDRALNRQVWSALAARLNGGAYSPLRVLELGAGIGTMAERAFEWDLFSGDVIYTALDALPENTQEASRRLPAWAASQGFDVVAEGGVLVLSKGKRRFTICLHTADVFQFAAREAGGRAWDLLIANAFLDLVPLPTALPQLFGLLKPGGLFYFTVTFDGMTSFEPPVDPDLDARIEALYHADMDARRLDGLPTGGSRAGRVLLRHLLASRAHVLAAGASDWVVYPGLDGYPADEAYFLHFILHTIERALAGHSALDGDPFAAWLACRHAQIENAELVYIAHQLDVLGQLPR